MMRGQVPDSVWEALEAEFTLPSLDKVTARLHELMDDPAPVTLRLVRVFLGEGTFCPGFQFLPGGQLHPAVTPLFSRAMELKVPHNYFSAWMITQSPALGGVRPVDALHRQEALLGAREAFSG